MVLVAPEKTSDAIPPTPGVLFLLTTHGTNTVVDVLDGLGLVAYKVRHQPDISTFEIRFGFSLTGTPKSHLLPPKSGIQVAITTVSNLHCTKRLSAPLYDLSTQGN